MKISVGYKTTYRYTCIRILLLSLDQSISRNAYCV